MFSWLFPKKTVDTETRQEKLQEDFSNIEVVAEYFKNLTGVTFDKQISILNSKTRGFCQTHNISSYTQLLQKISQDDVLKQELVNRLTTNETFFYREFKQIAELVSLVKQEHHPVTILCAPCATGEESYSIAIALLEADVPTTHFKIVGIDINSEAIDKAKKAIYKERNLRNLTDEIRKKYFTLHEDKYHLNEEVKKLTKFKILNIFEDEFKKLQKFDYIFSRNMLIYFDAQTKKKAVNILHSMQKDPKKEIFFGHADLF
jgi:chemotaxis protein methyltransferase CheR